jgi:hypothetical protein
MEEDNKVKQPPDSGAAVATGSSAGAEVDFNGPTKKAEPMAIWNMVLLIYLFLLVSIGYIAFWDQDFNNPRNTVGSYVSVLNEYKQINGIEGSVSSDEFTLIVQEVMKKNADRAGDLQELASQSFNIVLGAILAFLSGSVTMVFQRINANKRHPN